MYEIVHQRVAQMAGNMVAREVGEATRVLIFVEMYKADMVNEERTKDEHSNAAIEAPGVERAS